MGPSPKGRSPGVHVQVAVAVEVHDYVNAYVYAVAWLSPSPMDKPRE